MSYRSGPFGRPLPVAVLLPGAPSNLITSQVNSNTLSLSFTGASGATNHQYRYAPRINQSSGPIQTGWWTAPRALSGSTITNLWANTTYDVQVRGVNGVGVGPWSNVAHDAATATTASTKSSADWYGTFNGHTGFTVNGDIHIDCLTSSKWIFSGARQILTYSFPSAFTDYESGYLDGPAITGGTFSQLGTTAQNCMRRFLAETSAIIPVEFVEITENAGGIHADLRFAHDSALTRSHANFPRAPGSTASHGEQGDGWFTTGFGVSTPALSTYGWMTFMHETGHALGLSHTFDNPLAVMPLDKDWTEWSIMSYYSFQHASHTGEADTPYSNETNGYPQTWMVYDIQALQFMYGANTDLDGDTTYTFSATTGEMFVNGIGQGQPAGNKIYRTIWDGGGNDILDLTTGGYVAGDPSINLTPGLPSRTKGVQIAFLNGFTTPAATGNVYNAFNTTIDGSMVP